MLRDGEYALLEAGLELFLLESVLQSTVAQLVDPVQGSPGIGSDSRHRIGVEQRRGIPANGPDTIIDIGGDFGSGKGRQFQTVRYRGPNLFHLRPGENLQKMGPASQQ